MEGNVVDVLELRFFFKISELHGRPILWKHMSPFPREIELEGCPAVDGFSHPLYPMWHPIIPVHSTLLHKGPFPTHPRPSFKIIPDIRPDLSSTHQVLSPTIP